MTDPKKQQTGGDHYTSMAIQPKEVMRSLKTREEYLAHVHCTMIKYVMRIGRKPGSDDVGKLIDWAEEYRRVQNEPAAQADKLFDEARYLEWWNFHRQHGQEPI